METKSFYLTSEWWTFVAINLGTWLDVIPVPDRYAWIVTFATTVAYTFSRGIAKSGVAA